MYDMQLIGAPLVVLSTDDVHIGFRERWQCMHHLPKQLNIGSGMHTYDCLGSVVSNHRSHAAALQGTQFELRPLPVG